MKNIFKFTNGSVGKRIRIRRPGLIWSIRNKEDISVLYFARRGKLAMPIFVYHAVIYIIYERFSIMTFKR